MTRKEKFSALKRYFMAVLISLPILFLVDILIARHVPNVWIIVIDCFIIVLVYVLWLVITQKYHDHITKKRTEFLHKKEQEEKAEQERIRQEKELKKQQEEQKPQKIIQKQKRNYTNSPSKKHKKKKK